MQTTHITKSENISATIQYQVQACDYGTLQIGYLLYQGGTFKSLALLSQGNSRFETFQGVTRGIWNFRAV